MNTTDKKMSRGNFLKLGVGSIIGAALMPSVLANTFLRKQIQLLLILMMYTQGLLMIVDILN